MKSISALIKISRPLNFLITFFVIIAAEIICSAGNFDFFYLILAAISGGAAASAGNVINDYFDLEIDKINHPNRPLPLGTLTLNDALIFYIALVFISLIISFFINFPSFLIVTAATVLLLLYSFKLKRIILLGNVIIALLTGAAFIYGGAAVDNISYAVIPAVFAFLINLIREIIKDMEDIEGDVKNDVKTFPFVYGFPLTKNLILFFTLILIVLTFYPFLFSAYKIEYLIITAAVVNPLLIFVIYSIFKDDSKENLNKLSFILKLNMIFGLTAIYLGK